MLNRRDLLIGAGVLAVGAAAKAAPPPAKGQKPAAAAHQHHPNPYAPVVDAAADCNRKGEACLDHCLELLMTGDTSLAACAAAVRSMLATTQAVFTLASAGSKHTSEVARAALGVLRDCEAECKKHAAVHVQCKECGESCARLIQESSKLS